MRYVAMGCDGRVFGTFCVLDDDVIRRGNRFNAILKECKAMIEDHLRMMEMT